MKGKLMIGLLNVYVRMFVLGISFQREPYLNPNYYPCLKDWIEITEHLVFKNSH
jgi:hypothetical protein